MKKTTITLFASVRSLILGATLRSNFGPIFGSQIFAFSLVVLSINGYSQSDPFQEAQKIYSSGNYAEAHRLFARMAFEDNECHECWTMMAWSRMNRGMYDDSTELLAKNALSVFPMGFMTNATMGHLAVMRQLKENKGNYLDEAKYYYKRSLLYQDLDYSYKDLKQHLKMFSGFEKQGKDFQLLDTWLDGYWKSIEAKKASLSKSSNEVEAAANQQDYIKVDKGINQTASLLKSFDFETQELLAFYYYTVSQALLQKMGGVVKDPIKTQELHTLMKKLLDEAMVELKKLKTSNPYLHYAVNFKMGQFYKVYAQKELGLKYYVEALEGVQKTKFITLECALLSNIAELAIYHPPYKNFKSWLVELEKKSILTPYPTHFQIAAKLGTANYEMMQNRDININLAMKLAEEGYQLAKKINYEKYVAMGAEAKGMQFLAIGKNKEGIKLLEEAIELNLKNYYYLEAIKELNAIGSIYLMEKDHIKALLKFKKAAELTEEYRLILPVPFRVSFMNEMSTSYTQMMKIYAMYNIENQLFTAMELSRGRTLKDKLDEKTVVMNAPEISDAKKLLKDDEVFLCYSMLQENMVAILAMTNKKSKTYFVYDEEFGKRISQQGDQIKEEIIKEMKAAQEQEENLDKNPLASTARGMDEALEGMAQGQLSATMHELRRLLKANGSMMANPFLNRKRDSMLVSFYDLFLKPAEEMFKGKKTVIICPDGYLSFIPFETMKSRNGKYFVEEYDVKYIPSVSVYDLLQKRNYTTRPKEVLAFGAPVYQPVTEKKNKELSRGEELDFQIHVTRNIYAGNSQRDAIIEIQGHSVWSPLPGAEKEVKEIEQIVKNVDSYLGERASEHTFKELARTDKLKDYKVLHFATHGIVFPEYPELSSVVLSQFKEEKQGEDGYLTMAEIAQLKINADFVGMSACQTGLGGIYEGEGVVGLSQAFLLAGANGMSASLWNINDYATMLFMSGMYTLVKEKGISYSLAINEMKRKFIRGDFGEEFKHPNFWAPFAYYGK